MPRLVVHMLLIPSITMDSDLALFSLQMQGDEEDDQDDQERMQATAALLLIILIGAQESQTTRIHNRHLPRLYLCRDQLLPDPRVEMPWQ